MATRKVEIPIQLRRQDLDRIERQVKGIGKTPIKLSTPTGGSTQQMGMFAAMAAKAKGSVSGLAAGITGMTGKLGPWALGIGAGMMAIGGIKRAIGGWIDLSRIQQQAENDLKNALEQSGYTQTWYAQKIKDTAAAIQEQTTIGDEQSIQLATLALNMGIAFDKVDEAMEGSIGLAKRFQSAGLSQETAMKGIALAYQGNYDQLKRYIPSLRDASSDTERMAILQKEMAAGFNQAQGEIDIVAGKMQQLENTTGDAKEKLGEMFDNMQLWALPVLEELADYLGVAADAFLRLSLGMDEYRKRAAKMAEDRVIAEQVEFEQTRIRTAMEKYRLTLDEVFEVGGMSPAEIEKFFRQKGAKNMTPELAKKVKQYMLGLTEEGLKYTYGEETYKAILDAFIPKNRKPDDLAEKIIDPQSIAALQAKLAELEKVIKESNFTQGKWFDTKAASEQLKADIELIMSGAAEKYGNDLEKMKAELTRRAQETILEPLINPVRSLGEQGEGIKIPPIDTEEVDLGLDEFKAKIEDMASSAVDLGSQIGEGLARGMQKGSDLLREVYRTILSTFFDYLTRLTAGAIVENAINNFKTLGVAGVAIAIAQSAVITGMLQGVKGKLTGFRTGGVLVGEDGPEVIAPYKEFSQMAGDIVSAAVATMMQAAQKVYSARQAESALSVTSNLQARVLPFRISGRDLHMLIRLEEDHQARSSLGGA